VDNGAPTTKKHGNGEMNKSGKTAGAEGNLNKMEAHKKFYLQADERARKKG